MLRRLLRSWRSRVAVAGHSMEPTLRSGDWLLVDPDAYRQRAPSPGDLVVALDPRAQGRWLIKRVLATNADGRLVLVGDHPAHAADALDLELSSVMGKPWVRYWPPRRIGRLPSH